MLNLAFISEPRMNAHYTLLLLLLLQGRGKGRALTYTCSCCFHDTKQGRERGWAHTPAAAPSGARIVLSVGRTTTAASSRAGQTHTSAVVSSRRTGPPSACTGKGSSLIRDGVGPVLGIYMAEAQPPPHCNHHLLPRQSP